ncbi:MAG TPA: hypothetical protein VMR80_07365 [Candidatus Acidoferrum sp.]|jgi:hypothetical protein|nr:hypothetical protein [Candidatus Acidoferrum sp.]
MKGLQVAGVLLIVLGLLAFVVPIRRHQDHALSIGDAKITVQTETSEKAPPAVGVVLVAGGVIALVVGMRRG